MLSKKNSHPGNNSQGHRDLVTYYWHKKRSMVVEAFRSFLRSERKGSLRILDAGCGEGIDLFALAKEINAMSRERPLAARAFGFDLNPNRIDKFKKGSINGGVSHIIEALCGKIEDILLYFQPSSFDFILCADALEHLKEPENAVSDFFKLLAPGGWLLITTPNEGNILSRVSFLYRNIKGEIPGSSYLKHEENESDCPHISTKNYKQWLRVFSRAGFQLVELKRGALVYGRSWQAEKPIIYWFMVSLDKLIDKFMPLPQLAFNTLFIFKKPER